MILKNIHKLNTKFSFKTVYFLRVRGLTSSSYIVYDYTASGFMDLLIIYLQYIKYMYTFIQYTYNSMQYISFISNAIKM
jgi:hypothetical protein